MSAAGKEAMNRSGVDRLPCGTELWRKMSHVVGKRLKNALSSILSMLLWWWGWSNVMSVRGRAFQYCCSKIDNKKGYIVLLSGAKVVSNGSIVFYFPRRKWAVSLVIADAFYRAVKLNAMNLFESDKWRCGETTRKRQLSCHIKDVPLTYNYWQRQKKKITVYVVRNGASRELVAEY